MGRPEKGSHPKLHPDSQAAQANPNERALGASQVCNGIKESAQVGVDASTQGGANLPYGAERVNKQVGVVLGWNTLQSYRATDAGTEPGYPALTLADHHAGDTACTLQDHPYLT